MNSTSKHFINQSVTDRENDSCRQALKKERRWRKLFGISKSFLFNSIFEMRAYFCSSDGKTSLITSIPKWKLTVCFCLYVHKVLIYFLQELKMHLFYHVNIKLDVSLLRIYMKNLLRIESWMQNFKPFTRHTRWALLSNFSNCAIKEIIPD